jgi:hypothetical protein
MKPKKSGDAGDFVTDHILRKQRDYGVFQMAQASEIHAQMGKRLVSPQAKVVDIIIFLPRKLATSLYTMIVISSFIQAHSSSAFVCDHSSFYLMVRLVVSLFDVF